MAVESTGESPRAEKPYSAARISSSGAGPPARKATENEQAAPATPSVTSITLRPSRSDAPPTTKEATAPERRSEEHTSELQSLMRISYAVFCLKKKTKNCTQNTHQPIQHTHTTQTNKQ